MNNSKYEAVRAKIIMSCPELMELSFGCDIYVLPTRSGYKYDENIWKYIDTRVFTSELNQFGIWNKSRGVGILTKNEEFRIIGHTPRLSHVLRAIADEVDSTACMYPDGTFVEWDSSGDNYYILFRYDLTKDDLSLQSPETIDFLFKILCE